MSAVATGAGAKLFQPIKVGKLNLAHRIVMCPLTRYRANKAHVHGDLAVQYYGQRASTPGSLLITEATYISQKAGGQAHVPGIWSDPQIAAWKRVTDAVHAKGAYIFLQLWALGRAADPDVLAEEDPSLPYVSASDIPLSNGKKAPRPLAKDEIKEYVQMYATAASNAVHGANFDGVELHAANGYLVDQFTQDVSNKRTDDYGGSIENRCRFALEALAAITEKVGQERTGIRLSPWGEFQDMRMKDPVPTFKYLVTQIRDRFPNLAYIHLIEPVANGDGDRNNQRGESNVHFREVWQPRPTISAGGYDREKGLRVAEETGQLIAYGRWYIANPDLPQRLMKNIPLTEYDSSTFYVPESEHGYIDYPFADEQKVKGETA